MSNQKSNSKRQRKHKTSAGVHGGGGRVRTLSPVNKVLLGGGQYRTWKPEISSKVTNWTGVGSVLTPFDPVQARLNEKLYPHLFTN